MDYRNIRKSHWLYNLFHPFLHVEYRMLFRRMYFHNKKGVPANQPVLIAANHPTAFIDPIFFCIFFDPPVYNMTRGDIFRKPFFRKLLESMNMFPVYRRRDGYEHRDRNDEVFDFCRNKLREGVAVNIFVEGEHHLDKRVLSMQKGIARVAFGAYEKDRMDALQIVPVGCNYGKGDIMRDNASIIVGKPIFVKDYWPLYEENTAAAVNRLCQDIRASLMQICYHVEDKADDFLADMLLTIHQSNHPVPMIPVVRHHAKPFFEEKIMLDRLNSLPEAKRASLREQAEIYAAALAAAGINDEVLVQPRQGAWSWLLFFILGFLPAITGMLLRWPSAWLSHWVAGRKVKKREFFTSVIMGVNTIVNFLLYLGIALAGLVAGAPWLISLALLMPILMWFYTFYRERLQYWSMARRAMRLPHRTELLKMRQVLSPQAEGSENRGQTD